MKLSEELTELTCVAERNYDRIFDLIKSIISHEIAESLINKDDYATIDLGFGTLYVKNVDNEPKYKFIPYDDLDNIVRKTYRTGKSRLVNKVDETISSRIMNTYKDLF